MTHIDKISRSLVRQAPPVPAQLRDDELDVLAFPRLLRRRLGLIATVCTIVVMAALPPILSIERRYHAESRLLVQKTLTSALTASPADRSGELDLTMEVERLSARTITERVIERFNLAGLPEFNPDLRKKPLINQLLDSARSWFTSVETAPRPTGDTMDQVVYEVFDALAIRRSGQSNVIEIGFTSIDPELAAQVPNALIRIYINERREKLQGQVGAAREWVDARIEDQQGRVSKAHRTIKEFREATGLVSNDAPADAVHAISALSDRRAELTRTRAELAATLSGLETADRKTDEIQIVDWGAMPDLRRDLQLRQRDLAKLLDTYGNNYGDVVQTRSRIKEIEAAIGNEFDRYIQALKIRIGALDREEAAVQAGLESARNTVSRLNMAESELAGLLRSAEMEQAALDKLEQQRRILESQAELPMVEAEILSPASVPIHPQGRSRILYLIGAFLAAACVAVTIACIREMLDCGVRSFQQLQGLAGIAPAGMIPSLLKRGTADIRSLADGRREGRFPDAMRALILSLERTCGGSLPRSLVVTSALPGEGKSWIAAALAIELAAGGRQVLLVDGDVRHGKVHSLFGGKEQPGLADYLCSKSALFEIVRHDLHSGIDYIARGNLHFASLHDHQHQIGKIIQRAEKNDQIVIFDSAPILTTVETSLLAGLAERTLLVVRWGGPNRRIVDQAVHRLMATIGGDVAIALNKVDLRRHALYGFNDAGYTGV